ncbi:MAG: hypothetical protein IKG98_10725 [Ruminococcus sp.]|nr:hypothetical protein [Ruminococcus sp.]
MKKGIFAICMAAVMLTGCGSTAGSSESSKNDALATTAAAQQETEAKQEENTQETESSVSLEVGEYHNWNGIDMPFPKGWEVDDIIDRTGMICLTGGSESAPVYYGMDFDFDEKLQDVSQGHTLDELPEELLFTMQPFMHRKCKQDTNGDFSKVAVDSSTEVEFLGFPALCRTGTFNCYGDITIYYKAYYAYLDFPDFGDEGKHVPSFWLAYTTSNDIDALYLMEKAADLPLTKAKLHEE